MFSTSEQILFTDLGLLDYLPAWEVQREVHAEVVAGTRPNTVLFVEHPPVYTAGRRTNAGDRPADPGGAPVIDVDRGGMITFHGPGQLVAYPIATLVNHVKVVDFVRRLEEAAIRTLADFGLESGRVPGRSGVWMPETALRPERKLCAVGIRVSKGTSLHGIALNVDMDLSWYDRFVPCGIDDASVSTMALELGRHLDLDEVKPSLQRHLADLLTWQPYESGPCYAPKPEPVKLDA